MWFLYFKDWCEISKEWTIPASQYIIYRNIERCWGKVMFDELGYRIDMLKHNALVKLQEAA